MNGRLEHELKLNKNVKKILNDMPQCVSDFYMSIQAVRSPNTCLNYVRKLHHFLDYIDVEDISEIDADDIVSIRTNNFGAEVMVNDRENAGYKYRDCVIDPASLDDIMLYYVHRDVKEWS